jgi:hypothetical protein
MKKVIITIGLMVLLVGGQAEAVVNFNDGGYHVIDYIINDSVKVDYNTPGAGTQIDILSGGWLQYGLEAYGTSNVSINGGRVDSPFATWNNSRTVMYSGIVDRIAVNINSELEIHGGEITGGIGISNNSSAIVTGGTIGEIGIGGLLTMSGGTILEGIGASGNGLVTLIGTDFQVNGHNVSYGDQASTWATPGIDPWGHPWLTGTVTGILESSDVINNSFTFYQNGNITFIPEPATLFFFLAGSVIIRHKKRN